MTRTILMVEAGTEQWKTLRHALGKEYLCLYAANGEQALYILRRGDDAVSAVLLDMTTVADGAALLAQMARDERLAQIPALAAINAADTAARALALGAVSCLEKPLDPKETSLAIGNILRLCEMTATGSAHQVDKLTGLFNREAFFAEAERMIHNHPAGYYVLSCFNIANFKVVNDQYGEKIGDEILRHVGQCFEQCTRPLGGICCRYMADKFATLYPAEYMRSESIRQCHEDAEAPACINQKIRIRIGRCVVDDVALPVGSLYDRASMAEETLRGRYDVYIAEYRESMRDALLYEQRIVSQMHDALEGRQFETWFQPQYNHATGALIGAEALVRWRQPDGELILPAMFVPAFERNGFIYELDQYIWERVCAILRRWLDEGKSPLPISVNISRRDLLMSDFFDVLTGLVEKYAVPIELLRLEITESAFSRSPEQIVSIIKRLIARGFTVEIDDFGSGYSSLNTLKDVPAHIIKLDMRFLENTEDSRRGGNILESVVRMAKWLDMAVIAEGVETVEQADYLKSIGCLYVQGYLYAKPMPLKEYEALAAGAVKKEIRLEALRTVQNLSTNSFWDPNSMDTLIFNSYLGGACILEVHSGKIEMLRANDKHMRVIGSAGMTIADAMKLDWAAHMDEDSATRFFLALQYSIATEDEKDDEYLFYDLPGCDRKTYLRVTLRVIANSPDRILVYCLIENTTALRHAQEKEREAEQKRKTTAEQLQAIMDNVNGSITAATVKNGRPVLLFTNEQFYRTIGYTKEQYQEELADANEIIHPQDRERVVQALSTMEGGRLALLYRVVCRDKTVRWMQGNISMITIPGVDEPVQIGVAQDVTQQRQSQQRERETASQLQAILDNVSGGVAAVTFSKDQKAHYIFTNNEFYAMFGYTREQFHGELSGGLMDIVYLQDDPFGWDAQRIGNGPSLAGRIPGAPTGRQQNLGAWQRLHLSD